MKKIVIAFLIGLLIIPGYTQNNEELQAQIDNVADNLARDIANRWKFKGDFRFRNEDITQELSADRNRNRLRLRIGATGIVNDEIKAEFQLATTENGDARSSNQSLTDANSRKALDLDLAYVEYSPNLSTKLVLGKQKYPWYKTSSYFFDNDVNPEGASLSYTNNINGLFVIGTLADLSERSSATDSSMAALQVGKRGKINSDTSYTLAVGYFDHRAVQNYSVVQAGSAGGVFGNTTKTAGCLGGATTCLANDYDVLIASAELSGRLLDQPIVFFVDYGHNNKAKLYNNSEAFGFTYGKASLPGSYELGYTYQKTGKDALFSQWIDSDFGAGNSDSKGHAIRGAYQFGKNWRANFTYFINETNNDVPVVISNAQVFDREYHRLQLDLNYSF